MTQSDNETSVNSIRPMMPNDARKITRDYAEPLQSLTAVDDEATMIDVIMWCVVVAAAFACVIAMAFGILSA